MTKLTTRRFSRLVSAGLFLAGAATLVPQPAQALSLNAFGGRYFGTNETFDWAGEVTFGLLPMIDLGGFYEHSGESPSTHGPGDESRSFYGFVGRLTLPIIPIFADLRIGPHSIGFSNGATETGTSTRLGLGFAYSLTPGLSLLPRVGVALSDTNSTYPTWDGSIGLSLTIL